MSERNLWEINTRAHDTVRAHIFVQHVLTILYVPSAVQRAKYTTCQLRYTSPAWLSHFTVFFLNKITQTGFMCRRPLGCVGRWGGYFTLWGRKGNFLYGWCHVFFIGCCKGAEDVAARCAYSVLFSEASEHAASCSKDFVTYGLLSSACKRTKDNAPIRENMLVGRRSWASLAVPHHIVWSQQKKPAACCSFTLTESLPSIKLF